MTMSLSFAVVRLVDFYGLLILAYVIMSWFRPTGVFYDIYNVLAQICEPFIGIFRRIVPLVGMIDFSPWVAILVLRYIIGPGLAAIFRMLGL